jgi:uncharacterized protein (DUF488 family)
MPVVYTIGFGRKPLAEFITLLRAHGVDLVVDVRLRNTSQLAGYSKRDDLAFLLREGFAIGYEHWPELAPTDAILDGVKATRDWPAYERAMQALLLERRAEELGRDLLARAQAPCLLCAEPTPEHCHRRLIAEYWVAHLPNVQVVHL